MANTPRAKVTIRVRPPQTEGEKAAAAMKLISKGVGGGLVAVDSKNRHAIASASNGGGSDGGNEKSPAPGSPQQRGRKRAASCDAADPATRKSPGAGGATGKAWTGGASPDLSGGGGGDSGGSGGVGAAPTGMDVEHSSPAKRLDGDNRSSSSSASSSGKAKDVPSVSSSRASGDKSSSRAVAEAASVVPVRLPRISGSGAEGGAGNREKDGIDGDGPLPIEEIRSAGVVAGSASKGGVVVGGGMKTAPAELPLLELEKESTVDTLFELMESGQSVSVLVWDLLMMMPTNMRLYNGLS